MKVAKEKKVARLARSQRSVAYLVIAGDIVVFEAYTMTEGLAFIEGRKSGLLCKVLSLCNHTAIRDN